MQILPDIQPKTLLYVVTILMISQSILNQIGAERINNFFYTTYQKLSNSKDIKKLISMRSELSSLKIERNQLSAQDNYAKWTKLSRRIDKINKEISEFEKSLNSNKSNIDSKINLVFKFLISIPINILRIFYSRSPLFFLPTTVFPSFILFFINFPFLKNGSIGILFWSFCLNSILKFLIEFITLFFLSENLKFPEKPKKSEQNNETKKEDLKLLNQ